jgi:hypothetical protein
MMTERELSRRARHRLAVLRHVEEVSGQTPYERLRQKAQNPLS